MITDQKLREWERQTEAERGFGELCGRVHAHGLAGSVFDGGASARQEFQFSDTLRLLRARDQGKTSCCWMAAGLNLFRHQAAQAYGLSDFAFSQGYLMFYDFLEKSNFFLNRVLELADCDTQDRLFSYLLERPVQDCGQWAMFVNLVEKYGLVPEEAMEPSRASMDTRELLELLSQTLRRDACILRRLAGNGAEASGLQKEKEGMLGRVYRILRIALGKPPCEVRLLGALAGMTGGKAVSPKEFAGDCLGLKGVGDDYAAVVHAPLPGCPYHKSFVISYLGNVEDMRPVRYLNLPMDTLKELAARQLLSGCPVWFGADTHHYADRERGVLDLGLYHLEELTGETFPGKAEDLEYGNSRLTHAMLLKAVHFDGDGRTVRWLAENSYGTDAGHEGHVLLSDAWFDRYVYEAVIHKKYLSEKLLEEYGADPVGLPPWSPMGALAAGQF